MEIAIATQTAPSQWWEESAATICTAIDVINKTAEETRKGARRGR